MAASAVLLPSLTPPSYHRIVSQTLRIPADPKTSVPVGLLACQRDPLLRSLSTTVVSVENARPAVIPAAKRNKKSTSAEGSGTSLLGVVLHDTILFPEGGGQPTDIGHIKTDDGECWDVTHVLRRGGTAVHFVKAETNQADRFFPGAQVLVELGEEGYKRRLDHMCMHTSQHLLSALLETRLDLPTLSWSLTAYPTPSYVEIPRSMNSEEIIAIQEEANQLVFEGRQVHIEVDEFDRSTYEGVAITETGRTVGKGVPEDYTGGIRRVVVIEGVDRNPCCGTHLPTLHNLQLFLLPQMDSVSRASTATTSARLYFLCGPRLLAYLSTAHTLLGQVSSTLSCGAPQTPERVAQVVDERKKAEKRVTDVELELAGEIAKSLEERMRAAHGEGKKGPFVYRDHRADDSAGVLAFLGAIASAFISISAESVHPDQGYVIVLSSSPSSQTSGSASLLYVFGSDDKMVKLVGERLKAQLGVKGGGKGVRWSGKWLGVWKEAKEGKVVQDLLENVMQD